MSIKEGIIIQTEIKIKNFVNMGILLTKKIHIIQIEVKEVVEFAEWNFKGENMDIDQENNNLNRPIEDEKDKEISRLNAIISKFTQSMNGED